MKRLVKSTLTNISCIKCDDLIPVGELRFIDGRMHYHFGCNKPKTKVGFIARMKIRFKK